MFSLRTNEIPRTVPLVQVDYARVVDSDIGANKSDICAIRGGTISPEGPLKWTPEIGPNVKV